MPKRKTINTIDSDTSQEQVEDKNVVSDTNAAGNTDASNDESTTDTEQVDDAADDTNNGSNTEQGDDAADDTNNGSDTSQGDDTTDTSDESQEDDTDEVDDPAKLLAALRRARTEAKNLRIRAKTAERVAAQYTAAAEVGLALTWASRLQGDTPEALKADAEEFIKAVGSVAPPRLQGLPDDGVARGGSNEPAEERDLTVIGSRMYSN